MIIEVDANGTVVDEWRLWDIRDPYRNTAIKALDQGAVCLNIDPKLAGWKTSTRACALSLSARCRSIRIRTKELTVNKCFRW